MTSAVQAEDEPLWEYGIGFGYIKYEQYPASNEFSELILPFPTFQYRGEILRADDREGARAYLLRSKDWSLEVSGGVLPGQSYQNNQARQGMDLLPWMVQIGPQLRKNFGENWQLRLGIFQNISTDFSLTKLKGEELESKILYRWSSLNDLTLDEFIWEGQIAFTITAASRAFLGTYYDVPLEQVTADRATFESRSGLLSHELSYFQQIKRDRWALYFGIGYTSYDISINRASPLHKSDQNLTSFIGITYVLRESRRKETPNSNF